MLRKSATTTVPEGAPPPKKQTHEELLEERLDLILEYMHRFERRDRWRTVGSSVRNFVAIVPLLFFLGSIWYLYAHGEELLRKVADESARAAARYSQQSAEGVLDRFKNYLPGGGQSSSRR